MKILRSNWLNNWLPSTVSSGVFELMALVGLIALLVRLPLLNSSFWLDEAAQALEAVRPLSQQLQLAKDFQPPLFHLWLYLWSLAGGSEWWLRLASLVPGVLSVVLLSGWWAKKKGKRYGLVLGVLLATSSLHVFYSQELRPYMLAFFWASGSLISWYEFIKTAQKKWLLLLTVLNALGGLTSYVYVFWWVAQALTTIVIKRQLFIPLLKSLSVSFIWWLIWWPGFWQQWQVSSDLRSQLPGWEQVVSAPFLKGPFLVLAQFVLGLQRMDFNIWFGSLLGSIYFLLLARSLRLWLSSKTKEVHKLESGTWLVLMIMAFGSVWLFSWFTPVMAAKRILWLLPVFYLWVTSLWNSKKDIISFLIIVLLVINSFGLYQYWQQPSWQRENWREAVATIEAAYQPTNTAIIFAFDHAFSPWQWYVQEQFPVFATGTVPLQNTTQVQAKLDGVQQFENVIVFDYLRDLTDPQHLIDQELESEGYELLQVLDYPGIGFIRLYYKQPLFAWAH